MTKAICPRCQRTEVLKWGWWCTFCSLQWLRSKDMLNRENGDRVLTQAEKAERWGVTW